MTSPRRLSNSREGRVAGGTLCTGIRCYTSVGLPSCCFSVQHKEFLIRSSKKRAFLCNYRCNTTSVCRAITADTHETGQEHWRQMSTRHQRNSSHFHTNTGEKRNVAFLLLFFCMNGHTNSLWQVVSKFLCVLMGSLRGFMLTSPLKMLLANFILLWAASCGWITDSPNHSDPKGLETF